MYFQDFVCASELFIFALPKKGMFMRLFACDIYPSHYKPC